MTSFPPEIASKNDASSTRPGAASWGLALAIGAAFLWLYAPILGWLWQAWQSDEYYAHGPFLLPLSAGLLWQKRAKLMSLWRARPSQNQSQNARPPGLIFLALSLQLLGTLVDMNIVRALQAFSIALCLLGVARYLSGRDFEREIRFPILFLWLGVPLSGPMVETLTVPLQNYAASASAMLLGLLGMPIERVGVNLYTPLYHFVVAVPCSGLKTAITLFTLGVLIAHLSPGLSQFERWKLALLSVPVALLANTLRVMAIVWIGHRFGTKAAEGFLHSGSGLLLFALALGALLGIGAFWNRKRDLSPRGVSA